MAISKLKPRHASEGRSIAAALKDRLDYDKNPEKTDGGLLVTGYQCSPDTAWQEFAVSKQIYTATTGRKRAPDCVQNRDKALAKSSEGIQSLWWLFRYNFTMNDTTVFQIMELLREHFRGCFWYESLQFSIVQGMVYQKPENHRLIFAAD